MHTCILKLHEHITVEEKKISECDFLNRVIAQPLETKLMEK